MNRILFLSVLLLSLCSLVHAETWGNTNVQYLYGTTFDQVPGEDSVPDGKMSTITIEHAGGWTYGKNFFFVDLSSADFSSGKEHKLYGEWAPKLSLSKVSEQELSWGIIKDTYIAGEINQGDNFRAINIGLAVDLDIPGFNFVELSLYHRKDNFNDDTFQVTTAWNSTFELFSVPLIFEGFFDYYGTDYGTDIITQPRLLLDGKVFGKNTDTLQAGIELYYYKSSKSFRERINETVPQIMIKWIW